MDNNRENLITKEEINNFLNGRDPQERIVNLEYSYNNDFIDVYYRNENDDKCVSQEPFYPFLWATKHACRKLCKGDRKELRRLMDKFGVVCKGLRTKDSDGNETQEMVNGYTVLFYTSTAMSYSRFLKFFEEAGNPVYSNRKQDDKQSFTTIPISKKDERQYLCVPPQEQYLIKTGKRFFKGYDDYDQILRMIFDLETTGLDTHKDRIEQFGIRFNRPVKYKGEYQTFEKIFTVEGETKEEKDASELKNLDTFMRIIYTFRPDVIVAHNGENFDWNMIINACERLGTTIEAVSSKYFHGESIRKDKRESILKLGGEVETFNRTIVPGLIITDSLHAVRRAQATDSNFLQATLKYSAKYLKLKKENRVYVPGNMISKVWADLEETYAFNDIDGDWYYYSMDSENGPTEEFKKGKDGDNQFVMYTRNFIADGYTLVSGRYIVERYLLDDLWECDKVEYALNGTDFMLCKMIPVPYQKCCTMGTAGQWKAIMLAWSYENNLAIPLAENTGSFTGGLSRLLRVGYVNNVVKLDYNSLYPSIILTWGISDKNDIMNAMLYMLEYVLTTRETYKALKETYDKKCKEFKKLVNSGVKLSKKQKKEYDEAYQGFKVNDNRQLVVKKLGNSFFGSYGSNNGSVFPWKSVNCAERTTCTGRQSLRLMISHFKKLGYEPIVGDTDGFNFKLPENEQFRYTKERPYIGKGLNREVKEGKEYIGFEADVAEFNDMYMRDFHYSMDSVNKMGLGIDEVVNSTINFSRKNYADYFPENPYPNDVKLVGNTIKSKKMPEFISKFLDKGIRLLLANNGQEFLNEYYSYIDKIYNYQIPLKQIASKGKVKKRIDEYIADCETLTAAGTKKSRQAWMELAIKNNVDVNLGDTIYYINTGKSKSHADVKKVKHYYGKSEGELFNDELIDYRTKLEKEYKASPNGKLAKEGERPTFDEYVAKYHPEIKIEDEVILNCSMLSSDVVESETDVYCKEGQEYNVPKYIEQFNKRITPLLVCFSPEIRGKILITDPSDTPYFTESECTLCSGFPNKISDQDTYEQLMTMEDKEIRFWLNHPEWKIPFLDECGMNWDNIVNDYNERMEREKQLGIDKVRKAFEDCMSKITSSDLENFENGVLPRGLNALIEMDAATGNFVSKDYNDIVIANIYDVYEAMEERISQLEAIPEEEYQEN